MDPEERLCADSSFLDYEMRIEQNISDFNPPAETQSIFACNFDNQTGITSQNDNQMNVAHESNTIQDWDPTSMLSSLSFLERKIHQLRDLTHFITGRRGRFTGQSDELLVQQKMLINADLTSIIVQVMSTAGSLLPSVDCSRVVNPSAGVSQNVMLPENYKVEDDPTGYENGAVEDHELKSDDDPDEGENLPPGSYEILQLDKEEILAPHTHFCTICGKGFKRDANLRMHMRGHGDEYKTPAALAKPNKESGSDSILVKRYSCPFLGCKRNKDHKRFQPLKTILCMKNHYKRTHCDKTYMCSRCNAKKFSVIADLKTHEKHCGKDKWLCSCGTTFSRKDKLFGHIALFHGHSPAISADEAKALALPSDQGQISEATAKIETRDFNLESNVLEVKGPGNDPASCFSPLDFGESNAGEFHEFPRPPFEDSESSFAFLFSGSCDYPWKNGRY